MRSEVFADGDRMLGRGLVRGTVLVPSLLCSYVSHPVFRRQTECEPCTCQDQLFTYTAVT
jgi:hypothetical protein